MGGSMADSGCARRDPHGAGKHTASSEEEPGVHHHHRRRSGRRRALRVRSSSRRARCSRAERRVGHALLDPRHGSARRLGSRSRERRRSSLCSNRLSARSTSSTIPTHMPLHEASTPSTPSTPSRKRKRSSMFDVERTICLACGRKLPESLRWMASLRCHDCRDGRAPLRADFARWERELRLRIEPLQYWDEPTAA
jgi:hypothetical protein